MKSKEYNLDVDNMHIRQVILFGKTDIMKFNEVSVNGELMSERSKEFTAGMLALHNWKVENNIVD